MVRRRVHQHLAALALTLAALADSLTFLVMGTTHEANPVAAIAPMLSILLKAALVAVLVFWPLKYGSQLRAIGALCWSVGAASNLLVLGGM